MQLIFSVPNRIKKNKLKIENYICASNSRGKFEKFLFIYEQL